MVLSIQLMLGLLKQGESFCCYIDSESPYFRLKIEMNAMGLMRGMIYSDGLETAPQGVNGQLRLLKFQPGAEMPYQSVIDLQQTGISEIINHVLARSYQVRSRVFLSEDSDQSVMLHQLPLTEKEAQLDLDEKFNHYTGPLNDIMKKGLMDKKAIIGEMAASGFKFLADQPVEFKCGCSKKQMTENVKRFAESTGEPLFLPGQDALEVVCEYCKTPYRITKRDVQEAPSGYQ